jgi:hypothetical protein
MFKKSLNGMMILVVGIMLAFSLVGCGDAEDGPTGPTGGSDKAETSKTYVSTTANGEKVYTLRVTQNPDRAVVAATDTYVLLYTDKSGVVRTSVGAITSTDPLTLAPLTAPTATFTVTVGTSGITAITGNITFTDNTTATAGTLTPIGTGSEIEITEAITEDRVLGVPGMAVNYVYNGSNRLPVRNNATLTVLPATTIRFSRTDGGIEVKDGATIKMLGVDKLFPLDAEGKISTTPGTASGHITLKGGAAKGSWDGVYVQTTTENQFAYVDFLNGGSRTDFQNDPAVLDLDDARVSISYCKISGSLCHGIYIDAGKIDDFDHNTIENVDKVPIWMWGELSLLAKFDMTSDFTNNPNKYIQIIRNGHSEDATLNKTTVPYYFFQVNGLINAKLTINAGVTIYMGDGVSFNHWTPASTGRLIINGEAGNEVKFTRLPGTTQHWQSIYFNGLVESEINHCIFEYGGKDGDDGILYIYENANLTLNNVHISNSDSYGVTIVDWNDEYRLTHSNVTFGVSPNQNYKGNVRMDTSEITQTDLPASK